MLGDEGIGHASPVGDGAESTQWGERHQQILRENRKLKRKLEKLEKMQEERTSLEHNPPLDQGSASPGVKKLPKAVQKKPQGKTSLRSKSAGTPRKSARKSAAQADDDDDDDLAESPATTKKRSVWQKPNMLGTSSASSSLADFTSALSSSEEDDFLEQTKKTLSKTASKRKATQLTGPPNKRRVTLTTTSGKQRQQTEEAEDDASAEDGASAEDDDELDNDDQDDDDGRTEAKRKLGSFISSTLKQQLGKGTALVKALNEVTTVAWTSQPRHHKKEAALEKSEIFSRIYQAIDDSTVLKEAAEMREKTQNLIPRYSGMAKMLVQNFLKNTTTFIRDLLQYVIDDRDVSLVDEDWENGKSTLRGLKEVWAEIMNEEKKRPPQSTPSSSTPAIQHDTRNDKPDRSSVKIAVADLLEGMPSINTASWASIMFWIVNVARMLLPVYYAKDKDREQAEIWKQVAMRIYTRLPSRYTAKDETAQENNNPFTSDETMDGQRTKDPFQLLNFL